MTIDYNAKLAQDYEVIREKVRKGQLPIEERIKAVETATSAYLAAQDADFERKRAKQAESGGVVPLQLRNEALLHRLADLLMYEYLTWSHPDKMTIVENPIMSESQHDVRTKRERSISDVVTGKDDVTIGRRSDADGVKSRIYDYMTPERDMALIPTEYLDLYSALDNAGLTERQREAIDLVYFEGMTQEAAAEEMGITDRAVRYFLSDGIAKIRCSMAGK